MQSRRDRICFWAMLGGYVGLLAGVGVEWLANGFSGEWPSPPMIIFPVILAVAFVLLFAKRAEVVYEEEDDLITGLQKMGMTVYVNHPGHSAVDTLIDDIYAHNEAVQIQNRMAAIRRGRTKAPKGRNPGEVFKEYMEGSDPLDI